MTQEQLQKQCDELLAKVNSGDESSIEPLLDLTCGGIIPDRVNAVLGEDSSLEYLRDDLIQEVRIRVWQGLMNVAAGNSDPIENFVNWTHQTAYNEMLRAARDEANWLATTSLEPNIAVEQSEVSEVMEELFACCVSDRERRIITMRTEGHTQQEIAEEVGVDRAQISRELTQIQERYDQRNGQK